MWYDPYCAALRRLFFDMLQREGGPGDWETDRPQKGTKKAVSFLCSMRSFVAIVFALLIALGKGGRGSRADSRKSLISTIVFDIFSHFSLSLLADRLPPAQPGQTGQAEYAGAGGANEL